MWTFFDVVLLAAGYIAAIYTWPRIKVWIHGASSEAARLRQKASQIEAEIRSL